MLRFHPDKKFELERVADTPSGHPLILIKNPGTTTAEYKYVHYIAYDTTAIIVKHMDSETPSYDTLPLKTEGSAWELYHVTPNIAIANRNVIIAAGEDPDRPGELQLIVETPNGRLIATPNSDPDYPEIYLEYRSAAVGTSAPDRQVAILQFSDEREGFRLHCYEDDNDENPTHTFEGGQLPPEVEVTRDNMTHVTFDGETFDLTTPRGIFKFLTSNVFKTCLHENDIDHDAEYHDDGTSVLRLPYYDGTRNVAITSAADVWSLLEELHDTIIENAPKPVTIRFATRTPSNARGES